MLILILIPLSTGTYLKLPSGVVTYSDALPQFNAMTTLPVSIGLAKVNDDKEIKNAKKIKKDIFFIYF